eukprot:jgi/Mesvir1/19307/Mv10376-RA.1
MSSAAHDIQRIMRELQASPVSVNTRVADASSEAYDSNAQGDSSPFASAVLARGADEASTPTTAISDLLFESDSDQSSIKGKGPHLRRLSGGRGLLETLNEDYRERTAALQVQVATLQNEQRMADLRHAEEIARYQQQVVQLNRRIEGELAELQHRQTQVENGVPMLEEQVAAAKEALNDLRIAPGRYAEVKAIPVDKRSLKDHVMVRVYEDVEEQRREKEALRRERDLSREAAARAAEDVDRLTREVRRLESASKQARREADEETGALLARVERLETELQDALVQTQVLAAKGAMYNELKEKADKWERSVAEHENHAAVAAAKLAFLEGERNRMTADLKEREHAVELLGMDKAYLSKEVLSLTERLRKLEADYERQHDKLREAKRARQELYDKVMAVTDGSKEANEARLQAEISKIQEQARYDLDRIRAESAEVAERELRTLRELRDAAVSDKQRTELDLKECRAAHAELVAKYRELQNVSDGRFGDLWAELKMKTFEVDRLTVISEEAANKLKQASLTNEMLESKVKVLTEKYYSLESESGRRIQQLEAAALAQAERLRHYALLEREMDEAVEAMGMSAAKDGDGSMAATGWLSQLGASVPTSVRQRIQQSVQLAQRCASIRRECDAALADKEAAQKRVAELESELRVARRSLSNAQQPHGFLVELVQRLETELEEVTATSKQRLASLKACEADKVTLEMRLQAMAADLKDVLDQVHSLEESAARAGPPPGPLLRASSGPTPLSSVARAYAGGGTRPGAGMTSFQDVLHEDRGGAQVAETSMAAAGWGAALPRGGLRGGGGGGSVGMGGAAASSAVGNVAATVLPVGSNLVSKLARAAQQPPAVGAMSSYQQPPPQAYPFSSPIVGAGEGGFQRHGQPGTSGTQRVGGFGTGAGAGSGALVWRGEGEHMS